MVPFVGWEWCVIARGGSEKSPSHPSAKSALRVAPAKKIEGGHECVLLVIEISLERSSSSS